MIDYNLERVNFLVVDDNKHMRALVKSILKALGVQTIFEAGDGADAFKELRAALGNWFYARDHARRSDVTP